MDMQKIGRFLALLRKEQNMTQEELGEKLGVTNKTVSRWETGTYLPPAEMLQSLSALYGITINELLSGERLVEEAYREKAEQNIVTVLYQREFSGRERLLASFAWLGRYWWVLVLCLLPAAILYALRPFVVGDRSHVVSLTASLFLLGINIVADHVVFYVCERANTVTGKREEYRLFRILRIFWLVMLGVTLFVAIDLLGAFFYALTPAGTADGYAINSLFYDVLIEDHGSYLDNCYSAVKRILWHLFGISLLNIDLTILFIRRK